MDKMSRRNFARLGTAAALGAMVAGCGKNGSEQSQPKPVASAAGSSDRPNVIFFMTDDQRWDGYSRAGNPYFKTPNIDRIANEGAYFTNCFVTNSLCGPSRATCLTGKYSHNTGVTFNEKIFPTDQVTFLERAKEVGYKTAFVGKWHNLYWGRKRELDYYFGFKKQGQYINPKIAENDGPDIEYKGWVEDILADKTIDFIKNNKDEPFVMCHWFKTPHQDCIPAPRHAHLYEDVDFPKPSTFETDYDNKPEAVKNADMKIGGTGTYSYVQDWNKFMRDYCRVLTGVDENVGRILDTLDELGIADNTIIIYTSDNGYFLGEHNFFDKRLMYEPSLRIPLCIRYPKKVKPGTVIDNYALNIDFCPTITDYTGIPMEDMDGESMRPLLEGEPTPDWRTDFLYEYYAYPDWHMVKPHKGVRNERWKFIQYYDFPEDEFELIDLKNDPEEKHNLYGDPKYDDVVKKMRQRLYDLRVRYKDEQVKYDRPDPTIDVLDPSI